MTEQYKLPSHTAYVVTNRRPGDKGYWRAVGAAFPHKDGNGYDVVLDAMPLSGRIVLRMNEDEPAG